MEFHAPWRRNFDNRLRSIVGDVPMQSELYAMTDFGVFDANPVTTAESCSQLMIQKSL
jgi:hypothetical protein